MNFFISILFLVQFQFYQPELIYQGTKYSVLNYANEFRSLNVVNETDLAFGFLSYKHPAHVQMDCMKLFMGILFLG